MQLVSALFNRMRSVLTTLILLIIAGAISYITIPKESFPDVNIPYIITTVNYRGISPEDGELMLAKPIETEFKSLENVKEMRTSCFEGGCNILLEYEAGFDADTALVKVRDKVDTAKKDLPNDADEPVVSEINTSQFPIIVVNLAGNVPEYTMFKIAQQLEQAIEGLPGVLEADIGGKRTEQLEVLVDPIKMNTYQLSLSEFSQFLARSNALIAAGNLDTGNGRFPLKVPGLLKTIDDVANLPIKVQGDSVVKLEDIATVRRNFEDPERFARINGKQAITLNVKKRTGANIIDTVNLVKHVIEIAQSKLPPAVKLSYSSDQSEKVKNNLTDLENSVILSILLVMVIVIIMLGLRSGFLVGLAIPSSFLLGILTINIMGLTINMVVLFALILSVGMLVDGAIVITEYADRKMIEGATKRAAYKESAERMAWPVIASTATTLAAFMPLLFWTGVVGEFMKFMPLTLIAVLSASLIVALVFIPSLGILFGKIDHRKAKGIDTIQASERGDFDKLHGYTRIYTKILKGSLKHPKKIFLGSIMTLIVIFMVAGQFGKGVEFFPEEEPDLASILVSARGNLSAVEKSNFVKKVEDRISDMPYFETVYGQSGVRPQEAAEDVIGYVQVEFVDWDKRPTVDEIMKEVEKRIGEIPGIKTEIEKQKKGPSHGKPFTLQIEADDQNQLDIGIKYIRKGMDEIGGFQDIEDTRALPGIQWELKINRSQAAKFGVDLASAGEIVKMLTQGIRFSTYHASDSDEEIYIITRFPEEYRTLEQMENLNVPTSHGSIPLSSFVKITPQQRISTINRVDAKRVMTIKANTTKDVLPATQVVKLKKWIAEHPPAYEGFKFKFKGQQQDQEESMRFLMVAFIVAIA